VLAAIFFCIGATFMALAPDSGAAFSGEQRSEALPEAVEEIGRSYKRLRVEPVRYSAPEPSQPVEVVSVSPNVDESAARDFEQRMPLPSSRALAEKVVQIIQKHSPRDQNADSLAQAIVRESAEQGYDPLFVAAVIKSESTFNSIARSHKGAQGLMQLMPKTGAWLADIGRMPRGDLTDPGYNLKLGIQYLKQLEQGYGGDRVFTLIAYNWGPGRVESAADGKRRVPPEVMNYAIKILNDYRRWRREVI
jgi:soluble lytic murein transglycosylase